MSYQVGDIVKVRSVYGSSIEVERAVVVEKHEDFVEIEFFSQGSNGELLKNNPRYGIHQSLQLFLPYSTNEEELIKEGDVAEDLSGTKHLVNKIFLSRGDVCFYIRGEVWSLDGFKRVSNLK